MVSRKIPRKLGTASILGAILLCSILILNLPAAQATFPGSNGKIAFHSERDGNCIPCTEIYVMNADGSGQTRLTNNNAYDALPSWSPDGTKIAFHSKRDGNSEIYVMNADGSGQTRLTNNPASDEFASWSPDGTKIAFESDRDGNEEIYVMNADGSGQTRLTNNPAFEGYVSWSPDGTKIAFSSTRDGNYEIYSMNADGSGQTRLTNNPAHDNGADWQRILTPTHSENNNGLCGKLGAFINELNADKKLPQDKKNLVIGLVNAIKNVIGC